MQIYWKRKEVIWHINDLENSFDSDESNEKYVKAG